MEDARYFNTVCKGTKVDDVMTMSEASQIASGKFRPTLSHQRMRCENSESLIKLIEQSIGCTNIVRSDMGPDSNQIINRLI